MKSYFGSFIRPVERLRDQILKTQKLRKTKTPESQKGFAVDQWNTSFVFFLNEQRYSDF